MDLLSPTQMKEFDLKKLFLISALKLFNPFQISLEQQKNDFFFGSLKNHL